MKNYLFLFIVLFCATSATSTMYAQGYSGGNGTEAVPYVISNLEDLEYLSTHSDDWSGHFRLSADIDAAATSTWSVGDHDNNTSTDTEPMGFIPIGNDAVKFTGSFHGAGFTISNLFINRPATDYSGFFGFIEGAVVDSLGLEDVQILGRTGTGGLVGFVGNSSQIVSCYVTGSVSSINYHVGGLAGYVYNSMVDKAGFSGAVSSPDYYYVGGLVGTVNNSQIVNSYATGSVEANNVAGGLVGNVIGGYFSRCYAAVSVPIHPSAGGLFGNFDLMSTEMGCYWDSVASGMPFSPAGTGLSTREMKNFRTYTNAAWDFVTETANGVQDIWGINPEINSGYPFLAVQGYPTVAPEIAVKQSNTVIANETGNFDLGYSSVGTSSTPVVFKILNHGLSDLSILDFLTYGGNSTEFAIDQTNTASAVSVGDSTTFSVSFTPTEIGTRASTLHISSNDSIQNPFSFDISGAGFAPFGNALSFDGVNDYVDLSNAPVFQINTGTIECWFKTSNPGFGYRGLIVKQYAYGIFVKDNKLVAFDWVNSEHPTNIMVNDNKWHHVALSFSGPLNTAEMYLDGTLVKTMAYAINHQGVGLSLGSGDNASIQMYNGLMDEVRIWNTYRSAEEITNSMYSYLAGNEAGLISYYRFDQGNAGSDNTAMTNEVIDQTGHCYSGTLTNFSKIGTTSNWVSTGNARTPVLTTYTAEPVSKSTAILNGEIFSLGSEPLHVIGFCYSTSDCPTIDNDWHDVRTPDEPDLIISLLWGLNYGTTYYYRSFATNYFGTSYGEVRSFTTLNPEINIKQDTISIVSSGTYNFGNVNVDETSNEIVFTIENTGNGELVLLNSPGVEISGNVDDFVIDQSSLTSPIAPTSTTTFSVRFEPQDLGDRTATISTANDDTNENPYTIILSGKGTTPEIEVLHLNEPIASGGSFDFGAPMIGNSPEYSFTIKNLNEGNLALTGETKISISGPDAAYFSIDQSSVDSLISQGDSTAFTIAFSPTARKTYVAEISIANNDADENPYTITLNGTGDFRPFGNALNFDGINDIIDCGNGSSFETITSELTIEAWVKPNVACLSGDRKIVSKFPTNAFSFHLKNGIPSLEVFVGGSWITIAGLALSADTWYHLAATYDGANLKFYTNGVLEGTTPLIGEIPLSTANLTIGGNSTVGAYWGGSMDEVRIWNAARSEEDIQNHMYNYLAGNESGLLAYYRFDQGFAGMNNTLLVNEVIDYTVNCNKGTLQNFARNGATSNWVATGNHKYPILTTNEATDVNSSRALLQGKIFSEGSMALTTRGFIISTTECSTVADTVIQEIGTYFLIVPYSSLSQGTTYYYRAFATNWQGTNYGEQRSFTTLIPEISIAQGGTAIDNNGTFSFDENRGPVTFTIYNTGAGELTLYGDPRIEVLGDNPDDFIINQSSVSDTIATGDSTTFTITFAPTTTGARNAIVSISSDDDDENPYQINISGLSPEKYSGGTGTTGNPYEISTLTDLEDLSANTNDWGFAFVQTANINASETRFWNIGDHDGIPGTPDQPMGFSSIGNLDDNFTGTYNGRGFTIDSLFINRSTDDAGLFGYCTRVRLDSIHLVNVNITANNRVGALASSVSSSSEVTNCSATGTITGKSWLGGLVGGVSFNSIMQYCSFEGVVTGEDNVGGLSGSASYEGVINQCFSTGSVIGIQTVGGFVGYMTNQAEINNSYSMSTVSGTENVGGFAGKLVSSEITNSFSMGQVAGSIKTGGFLGNDVTVTSDFTGCLWDTVTSGQPTSDGGIGKSKTEMNHISTYLEAGWDFVNETTNGVNSVWGYNPSDNAGYPFLAWQGFESFAPVMNIKQETTQINSGDAFDFGDVNVGQSGSFKTFTIQNLGITELEFTGNPKFVITGPNASSFVLDTTSLVSPVSISDTTRFTVKFTPLEMDRCVVELSIENNDFDNNPYTISLVGTGLASHMVVKASNFIENESSFAFPDTYLGDSIDVAFTIYNTGNINLTLDSIPAIRIYGINASDFTMDTSSMSSIILPEDSTSFLVRFTPNEVAASTAQITIFNNDPAGNPFDFTITGNRILPFSGGFGTEESPFEIASLSDLEFLSTHSFTWNKYFIQTADINAVETSVWNGGEGFSPIGNQTKNFTGSYNGNYKVIDSLHINRPESNNVGLFGYFQGVSISSLGVINANIIARNRVGTIVGTNNSMIEECFSSGNITGQDTVGGLVGFNNRIIYSCYNESSVTGQSHIGGLSGTNTFFIDDNYNIGAISGSAYVGGLVGSNTSSLRLSYNSGTVTGETFTGGAVGSSSVSLLHCFWDIETSGQATSAGGVGKSTAEMKTVTTFLNSNWDFVNETAVGSFDLWGMNPDVNNGYPFFAWQGFESFAPEIQISQNNSFINSVDTVEFGGVLVGESSAEFVFKIKNLGITNLELTGTPIITVSGTNAENFVINQTATSSTIEISDSTTFTVTFTPTFHVDFAAKINIASNDTDEGSYEINLTGTGLAPKMYITSPMLIVNGGNFMLPLVTLGENGDPMTFTISNNGNSDLIFDGDPIVAIAGAHPDVFVIDQTATESPVSGEGSTTFTVAFHPTASGLRTAEISISNNDLGANPYTFTIKGNTLAPFSGGEGTSEAPYQIATLDDLEFLSTHSFHWDKHFIQTADIDAAITNTWNVGDHDNNPETPDEAMGFLPMGNSMNAFTGSYNGNGKTIDNLHVNRISEMYVGLFSQLSGSTVHDLSLNNATISGQFVVGGLSGFAENSEIANCFTSGQITSISSNCGGLIGTVYKGNVSNCFSSATVVAAEEEAGGLFGVASSTVQVIGCFSTGNVSGQIRIGGIVGNAINSGPGGPSGVASFTDCYSTGNVNGTDEVGGFVGYSQSVDFANCYSAGNVSGTNFVGGFSGNHSESTFANCFWDTENTGQTSSDGGEGKTTLEMKLRPTYTDAGWDFRGETNNIWNIGNGRNSGYPYFNYQYPTDPVMEPATLTSFLFGFTATSATISNYVATGINGNNVMERGVCFSVLPEPTVNDQTIVSGSGSGGFSVEINNLTPNTTYYVRTYSLNCAGISYSDEITLTTLRQQLTISGTFTTLSKEYDKTVSAQIDTNILSLEGVLSNINDVSLTNLIVEFTDVSAGINKEVVITDAQLSGADFDYYSLTLLGSPGYLDGEITQRQLLLTNFMADSKIYDGTTTVTGAQFSDNRIENDQLESSFDVSFADKNAGIDKEVEFSNIAITSGADMNNYLLATTIGTATATISTRELTIGGTFTALDKEFDGTTAATINQNNLTLATVLLDDDVQLNPEAAFASANVGNDILVSLTGATTLSGVDNANYALSLEASPTTTASISEPVVLQYMLTISIVGQGTSNPTAGEYEYSQGTVVDLYASPALGYEFQKWIIGSIEYTTQSVQITINENITATAHFVETTTPQFTLTMVKVGNGTINPPAGDHVYNENSVVSLTATPAEGWEFAGWTGPVAEALEATTTVTMTENRTITATFTEIVIPQYTLTISVVGQGSVNVNGTLYTEILTFDEGTVVNLTAVAANGWEFENWTGSVAEALEATTTITMSENRTITATFTVIVIPQYTLTISVVGQGTTTPTMGEHIFAEGTQVDLFASPAIGYEFEKWIVGSTEYTTQNVQITVSQNITATAYFVETTTPQFTLTMAKVGNGIINPPAGEHIYNENSVVTLTATPAEGWEFAGWTGPVAEALEATTTVTMTENRTITATFTEIAIPQYTLIISVVGQGSVNVNGTLYTEVLTFDEGTVVNLTAVAANGWEFSSWTGPVAEALEATSTVTMTENRTITATFTEIVIPQYTLTISVVGQGSVNVNGTLYTEVLTFDEGTVVNLTAVAANGWEFSSWTGSVAEALEATTNVTMTENRTITANFRPKVSATINPTSGTFDESNPENLSTIITWNDATAVTSVVAMVEGEEYELVEGEEYTITDINGETALLTFILADEKLKRFRSKEKMDIPVTINFDYGTPAVYTITFIWVDTYLVSFNVTDDNGQPLVGATITFEGIFLGLKTDGNGYAWVELENGNYTFTVSKEGYISETESVTVSDNDVEINIQLSLVGISNISLTTVKLYPNPVVDVVNLERNTSERVTVEVYSNSGALVETLTWSTQTLQLNATDYKNGMFYIRVVGQQVENLRFIKQ